MDIAIMIEGQNGLNWLRWQRLALAVEELGFAGLYRSDHFTNPNPPDLDSLECWVSLTWLASHTQRIQFGPLVSPLSFRDPVILARQAAAIEDLSAGRLILGLGAGWQEREHASFGYELLDIPRRFTRFEEGLEVITRLLRNDRPVSFSGEFYQLRDAILLPRPGGPPILIGGGGRRTLALAARYADEWNGTFMPPSRFAELNARLTALLEQQGRQPSTVRRSLMTDLVFGRDDAALRSKLNDRDASALRREGKVVGTPEQVIQALRELAAAGVQRVMLQWLDLDDLDGLKAFAQAVLPEFPSS